jgi:hypothetical protein
MLFVVLIHIDIGWHRVDIDLEGSRLPLPMREHGHRELYASCLSNMPLPFFPERRLSPPTDAPPIPRQHERRKIREEGCSFRYVQLCCSFIQDLDPKSKKKNRVRQPEARPLSTLPERSPQAQLAGTTRGFHVRRTSRARGPFQAGIGMHHPRQSPTHGEQDSAVYSPPSQIRSPNWV